MGGFAWVTLATNDSYSLGALVLAHSLKRVNTAHQLAIMITPGVSEAMRTQLSAVFNVVKLVDVLDSKDQENLALLARPELGITFTKLHCWKLTQFDKCVFLDADTIVLQNSDELFEREELSAAPDVGWPDCFNSGVFVFKPSEKTFKDLIDFALVHGTFDGGDQGLLNLFFSDWATKDISKHLPFVYNVVSSTVYTYLPAFKQFKDKLKIIHFIGSSKPWLQPFDTETGVARVSGDAQTQSTFIQLWWDLFCAYVHPTLTSSMSRQRLSTCYVFSTSTSSSTYFPTNKSPLSFFPSADIPKETGFWTLPPPQTSQMEDSHKFIDPWEDIYDKTDENDYLVNETYNDTIFDYIPNYSTAQINYYTERNSHPVEEFDNNYSDNYLSSQQMCDKLDVFKYPEKQENLKNENNYSLFENSDETNNFQPHFDRHILNENRVERTDNCHYQLQRKEEPPKVLSNENDINSQNYQQQEKQRQTPQTCHVPLHKQNSSPTAHPLLDQKHFPPDNEFIITNEEDHTANNLSDKEVGLAGALSAVKLGAPQSEEQNALQEHLRRQGWEEGNIDYMGRDSFDNIWKKISETLAGGTPPSQPAESTTQQAPVAENVPPSVVPDVIAAPPSVPSTLPSSEVTPTPPETIPTPPITQSQEKPVESVPAPISEPPKTGTELTEKTEEVPAIVPTTPAATQPTPQPDLKTTETKSSGSDSLEKPTAVLQPSIEQKPTEEIKLTELAPTSPTLDQTKLESAPIPPEPLKTDIKPAESPAEQKPDSTSTPEVPQQVELAKIDLVTPKADSIPESITSPPVPETSPAPAVPTPTSPQTVETQPTLPPQETTPAPQVLPSAQTTQEHPPSQIGQTSSVLEPLESGKITSVSEGPKETASDKSDLTPPPSPGQGAVPESKPTPPTPSTPTVTSPTPPASPAAAPQELPTAASKLKVQPETPPTPPVPQSAAQPTLPGSTGDEPPVPPKRKGGKGGSGAATAPPAAQGESASKSQQPKGGKGGKGKK